MTKRDSVWHNFAGAALDVMRTGQRAHHPSRDIVDGLMQRWFRGRTFEWLDVGVVGMVDYERLRPRLRFIFTGSDMSESVAEDARRYLRGAGDRVIVWDIEEPPDPALAGRFDLVTLRHVLNHCEYYVRPLEHAAAVLRPGGICVVVLHLRLIDGPDELERHRDWPIPGEVIGNRYERTAFLREFGRLFEIDAFIRVDDGRKPNDVIVGRRRTSPLPGGAPAPRMRRLYLPPGRRRLPLRILSRILFALGR